MKLLDSSQVVKAGSRPLVVKKNTGGSAVTRNMALQNQLRGCGDKPDPCRVMLQSMRTNPLVYRVVSAPAAVASQIELFPVYGLKSKRPTRADPQGTPEERYAWEVFNQYVDDCGSQTNLVRRHFEAKGSTGKAVQIRWTPPGSDKPAYEVVQNVPWVIEQKKNGQWVWHPERGVDIVVDEAREVYRKGFEYTGEASSPMMALVDLLALWELCMRALAEGVETDLLLGGILAMPAIDDDWADEFIEWLEIAKDKKVRIPFPLSYPMAGSAPQWIEGGGTIQDNIITLADKTLENIARFCPMDATTLLEGVGGGSHWNGILRQRENMQGYIWPELELEVLSDVVAWPFRPALAENDLGLNFDLMDWGISGDWQRAINQPDAGKHIVDLVKCGHLIPETLRGIGINEADLLTPDKPQWETFVERQRILGSPAAEEPEGGPGSEVFGDPPDPEADTSSQPNPTQRATVAAGWNEFGEW